MNFIELDEILPSCEYTGFNNRVSESGRIRGMTSEENRRNLQRAGGQYILGEKLRGPNINEEALNRGGRFKVIRENLHIKEVFVGEGTGRRRFVIAYNPEQAEQYKHVRKRNLKRVDGELAALNKRSGEAFMKTQYALLARRSMGRFLKELKSGKLKVDKASFFGLPIHLVPVRETII